MTLYTIVRSTPRLDELVGAIVFGKPSPFHKDDKATILKYEQATGLKEVRDEMIGMVCFKIPRSISDYSLICSRARLSSPN